MVRKKGRFFTGSDISAFHLDSFQWIWDVGVIADEGR